MSLFLLQSCSSSRPERFLGFGWETSRQEVMDSLRVWRFERNEAKARWEGGTIAGSRVDKLKLGFDAEDHLNFIEAHYQHLDHSASETIMRSWLDRTSAAHGDATSFVQTGEGQQLLSRWMWQFSDPGSALQDMIILVHFPENVTYQAGKNLPAPFDISK